MKRPEGVMAILGVVAVLLMMNSACAFGKKSIAGERPAPKYGRASAAGSVDANTSSVRDKLLLYDVTYYGLDLMVSTSVTAFGGNTRMRASVGGTSIDTLVIALINTANGATMIADSVIVDGTRRSFIHRNNLIQIPMSPPIPSGSTFTSQVFYHGDDGDAGVGLVRGSKYGMKFMYTYTWPLYASYLFPCKDMMEDWADSVDITIVTDEANKVVATGALVDYSRVIFVDSMGSHTGGLRWEFSSRWPIPPTDITFVVGPYSEYRTSLFLPAVNDSMVIRGFFFPASPYLSKQIAVMEKSKEYLAYFTSLFGPIPFWRNEHHFVTTDWTGGAMYVLGLSLFSELRFDTVLVKSLGSYGYFVPHELSHAWFGSTVGPLNQCDIWLAEGFATYAEELTMEHFLDPSTARRYMEYDRDFVMSLPGGSVYVPPRDRYNEDRVLDNRLTYVKGARLLHMLRFELGSDSLFFRLLREYLAEFAGRAITTEVLREFITRKTGKDFTSFFVQWCYGEGYPTFTLRWARESGGVRIISTQSPSMPSVTPLFQTPLEFRLIYAGGDTTVRVFQSNVTDTFQIATSRVVDSIVVDPNGWLLCKVGSITTSVGGQPIAVPGEFALEQNYPNPCNPVTSMRYSVGAVSGLHSSVSDVRLAVYDLLGREVAVLVNEKKAPGEYEMQFDGSQLSSGVYFYRMQAGDPSTSPSAKLGTESSSNGSGRIFVQTRKLLLLR
jgi:aminopeptidase N